MTQALYKATHLLLDGTVIPVMEAGFDPKVQKLALWQGSAGSPVWLSNEGQKPMYTLVTPAIASAITALGSIRGKVIAANVTIYFGQWSGLGQASGSVHKRAVTNDGLIVVRGIKAPGDKYATMALDVYAITDGTNAPTIFEEGVAAPTESLLDECFFGGPMKLGSDFYETRSWDYNPNPKVDCELQSGSGWPTRVDLVSEEPEFDVDTTDPNLMADLTTIGSGSTDGNFFLRRATAGGLRVANATETHISLRVPAFFGYPGELRGTAPDKVSQAVKICARFDGTNAPVIPDTTAAIA